VRILFVTSRFPHPPYRGDQVRAYHQIRLLSSRHALTLLSFAGETTSVESVRTMVALCRDVKVVPLSRWRKAGNLVRGLADGRPVQVAYYESPHMRRLVDELLPRHDVLHAQLVRMATYVREDAPAVLDLVDALSANLERRAATDSSPLRFAAHLEAARLRLYEPEAIRRARRSAVVSAADREALGSPPRMAVVPQGVELALYPFAEGPRDSEAVVFTGNLGYFANVDAACFLAREVWPRIRASRPAATLQLIGDRPAPRVKRLAAIPGVQVLGPVESMHPYLSRARVVVAPMRTGSGMQNKVLEAMASGAPVVATPLAAAPLDALDGEHLLLARDTEEFAAQVLRLLSDEGLGRRLAASARQLVETHFTLERSVEILERLYQEAASGSRLEASA
jgi:polysaccharide biosynthesis protein PslH